MRELQRISLFDKDKAHAHIAIIEALYEWIVAADEEYPTLYLWSEYLMGDVEEYTKPGGCFYVPDYSPSDERMDAELNTALFIEYLEQSLTEVGVHCGVVPSGEYYVIETNNDKIGRE